MFAIYSTLSSLIYNQNETEHKICKFLKLSLHNNNSHEDTCRVPGEINEKKREKKKVQTHSQNLNGGAYSGAIRSAYAN